MVAALVLGVLLVLRGLVGRGGTLGEVGGVAGDGGQLARQQLAYDGLHAGRGQRALLVDRESGLKRDWLASLCADVAALRAAGSDILVVSSGAIALGRNVLGLGRRALKLEESRFQRWNCEAASSSRGR